MSRAYARARGESGSSRAASPPFRASSLARPSSRRAHRSRPPPITDDSTSRWSHFQGARSVPSRTGAASESGAGAGAGLKPCATYGLRRRAEALRFERTSASAAPGRAGARRYGIRLVAEERELAGGRCRGLGGRGQRLLVGIRRHPRGRGRRRRARLVGHGHLAERDVLGEAARRQAFGRAREQREKRAPRRVRRGGAAREPRGHARAAERALEQAGIRARRAQDDGHLVEADAAARLLEHAARDLDGLAALAGRGEEGDVVGPAEARRCGAALVEREEVAAEAGEIVLPFFLLFLDRDHEAGAGERAQGGERPLVAGRHGGERPRRGGRQRGHEAGLGRRLHGHVEQHERPIDGNPGAARPDGADGRREQRRAIRDPRARQLRVEAPGQLAQVAPGVAERVEGGGVHRAEAQVGQRGGQRARKAAEARDGRDVGQSVRLARVEGDARRHGLGAETRRGRQAAARELERRHPRGELPEAEAVQAERGAPRDGDLAHQLVGRLARRADHQHLARRRARLDKRARRGEADAGVGGDGQGERGGGGHVGPHPLINAATDGVALAALQ